MMDEAPIVDVELGLRLGGQDDVTQSDDPRIPFRTDNSANQWKHHLAWGMASCNKKERVATANI